MMAGSVLGHKEVRSENTLKKGRKSERPVESVWLEPSGQRCRDHRRLVGSALHPKPRAEPLKV